jgi:signal peptidase I
MACLATFPDYNFLRPYRSKNTIDTLHPRPHLHTGGLLQPIIGRLWVIVAIYALINLASVRYMVEGSSMEPAFETGQILMVSRLHYLLHDPERGDIVIFHLPEDVSQDYIKRVIAVPGDTVEIRDASVYLNGTLLDETYINEPCTAAYCDNRLWTLGPDEYFVMGDNRNHSSDSRIFGPVKQHYLLGKVILRYWPLQRMGLIN